MLKKDMVTIAGASILVFLVCLPLATTHANDVPDFAGCPTDLSEAPKKFKKEFDDCIRSQDARHEAKLKSDRVILAARFKAHPEQLKNPKLCDNFLVKNDKNSSGLSPFTKDSYYMMEACNEITGITARLKRAHDADCASGNPNGPCAIWAQIEKKDKQKLDEDLDELKKSFRDAYTPCAISVSNCGDGGAMERIDNEYRREQELNNMRQQFQSEDEQQRIDEEQRKEEEDEDDEDDYRRTHGHY